MRVPLGPRNGLTNEALASGNIIRDPPSFGSGYWVGAPGLFYAKDERALYLTYRIRRPRGVTPDRGGEARIARSTDFRHFEDLWSATKDQFSTASIERCALRKGNDGLWRYYVCFVDPSDGRWSVSMIKASSVQDLNPNDAKPLFTGRSLALEGVKDPWILEQDSLYYMFLSVAIKTPQTSQESHATLDIFNTGECLSATALAISADLDNWEWQGIVFSPESSGWDRYCRRINSVIPYRGKFLAFYDGSASHAENYEEKTGWAVSENLREWKSLTARAPFLTSPHASASLRYLDAQLMEGMVCLAYEFARADKAHDLRAVQMGIESLGLESRIECLPNI
jgi:hypothetical protein